MINEDIKPKPKRVVKRIGDVFCVEFGNGFKSYFQYVAKDSSQLHSEVIRAFYTHYPIDYVPVIEDIIKDKVAFYAHTFITMGIKDGSWYKVGKSNDIGYGDLEDVVFGTCLDFKFVDLQVAKVDPAENWTIWCVNKQRFYIGRLPDKYHRIVYWGAVMPTDEIVNYSIYGYYKILRPQYEVIERHPRPDSDSYLRKKKDGIITYYHFHGEFAIEQIDIFEEFAVRMTVAQPVCDGHFLYDKPFGNILWETEDFITAEEFEAVWNSLNPVEISRKYTNQLSD